ncbi:MAG: hypothetical protein AAB425_00550, partial [Bdellovibrionota bacterium]
PPGQGELVLNGDIFDFDAVMALPTDGSLHLHWLEQLRGLNPEENKSRFKMERIIADHPIWFQAASEFVRAGHKVVFVIGNHDIELHWPSVQDAILSALKLPDSEATARVVFTEWFYLSGGDTLFEHGNQYDSYSLCANPIHPTIRKNRHELMRLPFGNLANKFMMNGMGYFNPHVQSRYIMTFAEYVRFFFTKIVRSQPMLVWTWFWGALVTLIYSIHEGLLPSNRDPLTVEDRVEAIAARAQATPRVVRQLYEIRAHPSSHEPLRILRELWLDRALLVVLGILGSFYLFSFVNVFWRISIFWMLIPLIIFTPFFLFYARSIKPEITTDLQAPLQEILNSAKIVGVNRLVHGHTHCEIHTQLTELKIELLNAGSWSPAFSDVECKIPIGNKPFVWIHPPEGTPAGTPRVAQLFEWKPASNQAASTGEKWSLLPQTSPSATSQR